MLTTTHSSWPIRTWLDLGFLLCGGNHDAATLFVLTKLFFSALIFCIFEMLSWRVYFHVSNTVTSVLTMLVSHSVKSNCSVFLDCALWTFFLQLSLIFFSDCIFADVHLATWFVWMGPRSPVSIPCVLHGLVTMGPVWPSRPPSSPVTARRVTEDGTVRPLWQFTGRRWAWASAPSSPSVSASWHYWVNINSSAGYLYLSII